MSKLEEVVEVLARNSGHETGWTPEDSTVVHDWLDERENEREKSDGDDGDDSPNPQTGSSTASTSKSNAGTSKGGKS